MKTRNRIGLIVGIIIGSMVPLAAATTMRQMDEPWPILLANDSERTEPNVALLLKRANVTLEKLIEDSRVSDDPL